MLVRLFTVILLVAFCGVGYADTWGIARGVSSEQALSSCDASGSPCLTDAQLPSDVHEIVFLAPGAHVRSFGVIALTNRTLTFSGYAPDYILRTDSHASVFRLSGGNWTFNRLTFSGLGLPEKAHYFGGAIDCVGGALTLIGCTFTNLAARFNGGAVSARLMTGPLTITDSTFRNNASGILNGTGGALYATAASGHTVPLRLRGCCFEDNVAQNGGAVTTVSTTYDDESPVLLEVSHCSFARNTASFNGGALYADGPVVITNSVFTENCSGVQGGALCLGGAPKHVVDCLIGPETLFSGNRAESTTDWTCGGAIALMGTGARLVISGRHVTFDRNVAFSPMGGFGGAVFTGTGTDAYLEHVAFLANEADSYGGGVYGWGRSLVVSTSIFSNDLVHAENGGQGGAVSVDATVLAMTNVTIRGANAVALDAVRSQVSLINCLVADNSAGTDLSVYGTDAKLTMRYCAYGTSRVSDAVKASAVMEACLSKVTASVYEGTSLLLNTAAYNPVACEGLVQDALDFRAVRYGWQGSGSYSMGAYACPAPGGEPMFDLLSTSWFHNRADGLYYPQVVIRFLGGDATRVQSVSLSCDGKEYALPESCLAQLRAATNALQTFVFGVDESHWVPSASGKDDFGYIIGSAAEKKAMMLFSVSDPTRSPVSVVGASYPLTMEVGVLDVAAPTVLSPRALRNSVLPTVVTLGAQFTDFVVGECLSGKTSVPAGAAVTLWGCPALGDAWQDLGVLAVNADGSFSMSVPAKMRFFKLSAEVSR